MKRILYLNYEFPPLGGGASPISYEIAKGLVENGEWEIDVVTMGFRGLPSQETPLPNLRIHRVPCLRSKKEICHPWEQLSYLYSAASYCEKLIKKNRYNICYAHFIIPTGALARRLKRKHGIPYVLTSHGSDVLGYNPRFRALYPLLRKAWQSIVQDAATLTVPSHFLQSTITRLLETPRTIEVLPNAIDSNNFSPSAKQPRILMVSRLTENKGIQDVLMALRNLDIQNWKVDIVGEGPFRETLEKIVQENNLSQRVHFHGWINRNDDKLRDHYAQASIFILPSHFENMNVTLLEAMSSACAVIATDVGGNSEVLGNAGILVQSNNKEEMRSAIQGLINNEGSRKNYQEKARQRIQQHFSWSTIIQQYSQLLSRQSI